MPTLTVGRDDAEDLEGDTVRIDGDELVLLRPGADVRVPLEDVRSIVAGEPASGDEPATDEGEVLLA